MTKHRGILRASTKSIEVMAPSKRADNKRMIGIYVDVKLAKRFQEACEYFGLTMSTVLTSYITEKANEYERILRNRKSGDSSQPQKED